MGIAGVQKGVGVRKLYEKVCECGQRFTTSDKDSEYCNKKCASYYRAKREGMPVFIKPSIEKLKEFKHER
jgi:uncharacterized lipoprotein NlpE involved in copper resistance